MMERGLTAWLVYDSEGAARNRDYIRMHCQTGRDYGIHFRLLTPAEAEWEIRPCQAAVAGRTVASEGSRASGGTAASEGSRASGGTAASEGSKASGASVLSGRTGDRLPDFAIVRTIRPDLSARLESAAIPTFNPSFVSRICNDKAKTMDYVRQNSDVPVIETVRFENVELSENMLRLYPDHVIKAVDGHGGRQVFLTSDSFSHIRQGIGTSDFVIQPYVRGRGKDVRVYVIGGEIVGAVERAARDGFRSNFSLGGAVHPYKLDSWEIGCVDKICGLFDFGLVGIDFIIREEGGFVFNEIEDVVGARMLYQCQPDVGLLERYFLFIKDKIPYNGY